MPQHKSSKTRRMIAAEAARIIATEKVHDFQLAKEKALERLHLSPAEAVPGNAEVQEELRSYQALFQAAEQPQALRALREMAGRMMHRLQEFQPYLVGAVLDGTADESSAVHLHVFADSAKPVVMALLNAGLEFESDERSVRLNRERREFLPVLRLAEDGMRVELTVLPLSTIHNAPLSHIDGRPVKRANAGQVAQLLAG